MTKPNEVLEAMVLAMADAELAPNSSYQSLLKAALRAARELGHFLVPEIMNMKMSEAQLEDWTNCAQDEWQAAIRAAPDILAEGE